MRKLLDHFGLPADLLAANGAVNDFIVTAFLGAGSRNFVFTDWLAFVVPERCNDSPGFQIGDFFFAFCIRKMLSADAAGPVGFFAGLCAGGGNCCDSLQGMAGFPGESSAVVLPHTFRPASSRVIISSGCHIGECIFTNCRCIFALEPDFLQGCATVKGMILDIRHAGRNLSAG